MDRDRSSPESYSDGDGDGDDSEPISRRGKRSSSGASDGVVATPYAVPLVIRTAAAAARSTPTRAPGYSPKLSMDMASTHSWAPYTAVIPALRSLSLKSLKRGPGADLEAAKELIAGLYSHAAPFAAARRFPDGEVYVCLDRAPLSSSMQWIQQHLMRAEVSYGDDLTRACAGYASGIGSALDEITRVDDLRGGAPILYDRAAFELAFLLTWTEP